MHYSSGNCEAFVRPRKPEGADKKTAWFVGSGLAGCQTARNRDPLSAPIGTPSSSSSGDARSSQPAQSIAAG